MDLDRIMEEIRRKAETEPRVRCYLMDDVFDGLKKDAGKYGLTYYPGLIPGDNDVLRDGNIALIKWEGTENAEQIGIE